jgi:carbonic anhydrase/acetyltransferase-like protein (isoleucine patch superfamily)
MVARTLGLLALGLAVAGCSVQRHDDSVSKRFGTDYFGVGGAVNLTDSIAGDAVLAGGQVTTASEVKGDLIAAGGGISIGGGIGDDLYAAGGEVQVDAIVAGNARVAGGDITLGPATVVGGALSLTGGRIRFEGNVRDHLQASGASVHLDGVVQGDAELRAEEIDIGPNTRIDGKLVVHSSREPVIPEGVQIAGGVEFHPSDVGKYLDEQDTEQDTRTVAHDVGSFLWMLGVFVAGTLFMLAFPAYSARAAQWIGREPLRSLGLGFVILVCLPVLVVLLLITIIGIPLALIIALLYLLLLFLGWVTAAMFLGQKLLGFMRRSEPVTMAWKLFALLLAVLALWLVGLIPILGGWVRFAALLLGIGALVWQGWPRREESLRGAT